MRKVLLCLFALCCSLLAANFKLYLKDGGYHLVSEYKVDGDRVRYYSVERSDWEEIPLDLVDLNKTTGEVADRKADLDKVNKEIAEEKAAAREIRNEVNLIPQDHGVYRLENGKVETFPIAESTVHNDKGRMALKILSPIPLVPGKATVELAGEHSQKSATADDGKPEFYIQLSSFEEFGIIKLTPQKGVRIAEHLTIDPITKETAEQRDKIPVFTKEMSDSGLFKLWPQDPLEKGEYAVVEFTEGKLNMQMWDFRVP
jgi:hypothetical protein